MRTRADIFRVSAAFVGATAFWIAFGALSGVMRPPTDPHPGLKDDALKAALRADWDKKHRTLSYYSARKHLFEDVDGNGRDAEGTYTGDKIEYFKQPLPTDGAMEHAWPITRLPPEARTDLHHLFAVTRDARVARLNLHYGKVLVPVWSRGGSRSGPSSKVKPVFEVRKEKRGDIARAMFYISTMYDVAIPDDEESTLRTWHRQEPVDKAERARNQKVVKYQKSANPFVDHPGLTKRIRDF